MGWRDDLLKVKKILDELEIKFWLCGTLLSRAVRKESNCELGRINIRVKACDWKNKVLDRLERRGFKWDRRERKLNGERITTLIILSKEDTRILIRLMYYYPPEDIYLLLDHDAKEKLHKVPASFYKKDCFIEFLGQKFRVPNNPKGLLEHFRGERPKLELTEYMKYLKEGEKNGAKG